MWVQGGACEESGGGMWNSYVTNRYEDDLMSREMMIKWVSGHGEQPASWRTLVRLLREFGRNTLAQDIEDTLTQD